MKLACIGATRWLWVAVAALTAMPTWADGELDTTFGANGVSKIQFPDRPLAEVRDLAVVDGGLEAVGFQPCSAPFPDLLIAKLSANGTVIGSPGTVAQNAIQCPAAVMVDGSNGDIYMSGGSAVARFDASGIQLATYQVDSSAPGSLPAVTCTPRHVLLDGQGRFLSPCIRATRAEFGTHYALAVLRVTAQGAQLQGESLAGPEMSEATVIAQDAAATYYYVGGSCCLPTFGQFRTQPMVVRLLAAGTVDTSYAGFTGTPGVASIGISGSPMYGTGTTVNGVAPDASGNLVIGGRAASLYPGYVARLDPAGMPDTTFGANGAVSNLNDTVVDVRTDASGRVYALGEVSTLQRLKSNGSADATFGSSSNAQGLNGSGSAWRSMRFAGASSAYLLGGAVGCDKPCNDPATTALIAKVVLASQSSAAGVTTTILNTSAATVPAGQTVTLTATVLGTSPTGHVTFYDGAKTLATAALDGSRSASYQTAELSVGAHTITVSYGGDGANAGSVSQPVLETVKVVSATVISASTSTVGVNQPITFIATVAGTNPTGTVTFTEHWKDIDGNDRVDQIANPVPIRAGLASMTVQGFGEVGARDFSATYSGDSENAASTSLAIVETITNTSGGTKGGTQSASLTGGGGAIAWTEILVALLAVVWSRIVAMPRGSSG